MMELKQREDTQRHQLEATKRELDSLGEKLKEAESKLAETAKKADNFEKQTLQVHWLSCVLEFWIIKIVI